MASSKRIYLTGADGMLGTALLGELAAGPETARWVVRGVSIADFDIGDADATSRSIEAFEPDIVVHAAAHAIVDDCEADPKMAMRVNVAGTRNVATACRRVGARLVYVSSDYVFDGRDTPPGGYRETDTPSPVSVYGLTKLAGERISATVDDHLIIRTSWLFGGTDDRTDNVLATIRGALRGVPTRLIDDQFSRPTYTVDLARAVAFLLTRGVTGTIHVANEGTASWHEVGHAALAAYDPGLAGRITAEPVSLHELALLGGRPLDSTLNTDRLAALGCRLPSWRDAVRRFCAAMAAGAPVAAGVRVGGSAGGSAGGSVGGPAGGSAGERRIPSRTGGAR
jgi:dTDP-4-dehydrorhamnose reductase